MARPKPWIGSIPRIRKVLEASTEPKFGRRDVERLFGVGRSAATELMGVVGAKKGRSEAAPVVTRAALLDYVKFGPEAHALEQEETRRKNLAVSLAQSAEEAKLRAVEIPVTRMDQWAQLRKLPNVQIEPGLLTVRFSSPRGLMAELYRLVHAAGADWDLFERMCEQAELLLDERAVAASARNVA